MSDSQSENPIEEGSEDVFIKPEEGAISEADSASFSQSG